MKQRSALKSTSSPERCLVMPTAIAHLHHFSPTKSSRRRSQIWSQIAADILQAANKALCMSLDENTAKNVSSSEVLDLMVLPKLLVLAVHSLSAGGRGRDGRPDCYFSRLIIGAGCQVFLSSLASRLLNLTLQQEIRLLARGSQKSKKKKKKHQKTGVQWCDVNKRNGGVMVKG